MYYLRRLKFTLKHLKCSYMFQSYDHPQGAYSVPCWSYNLKHSVNYFVVLTLMLRQRAVFSCVSRALFRMSLVMVVCRMLSSVSLTLYSIRHTTITTRGCEVSSTPRPHFTRGIDPVPILQEVRWAPGPVWTGGKSRPHRNSITNHPASSQSLYRLSYPPHLLLKYSVFISDFIGTWNFSTNVRNTHIKFHENPSNGSRVVPWGLTAWRTDGRTEPWRS